MKYAYATLLIGFLGCAFWFYCSEDDPASLLRDSTPNRSNAVSVASSQTVALLPSHRNGSDPFCGRYLPLSDSRVAYHENFVVVSEKVSIPTQARTLVREAYYDVASYAAQSAQMPLKTRYYVPGELLIALPDAQQRVAVLDAIQKYNATVVQSLMDGRILRIRLPEDDVDAVPNALTYFKTFAQARVSPNALRFPSLAPDDPSYPNQWAHGCIASERAWEIATALPDSFIVAIIDTGVDTEHQDLKNNLWVNEKEIPNNNIDDDANGYVDDVHGCSTLEGEGGYLRDDHSHGTHCFGILGASGNNALGVCGVVWRAKLLSVRFMGAYGGGTIAEEVAAFDYARLAGAKVLSCSFGGDLFEEVEHEAIAFLRERQIVLIVAAGNTGKDIDLFPQYPAAYDLDNIVTVLNLRNESQLASNSSYGKIATDIAAPGTSIYSTIPGSAYGMKSGTSMATPCVAGIFAMMWAHHPRLTYLEAIARLYDAGVEVSALSEKCSTGKRVNFFNAMNDTPFFYPEVSKGTYTDYVSVSWDYDPTYLYTIYRCSSTDSNYNKIHSAPVLEAPYLDTTPVPGQLYRYKILKKSL